MEFRDFLEHLSVKARNFKCFGGEPQGFESIKRFNLIIGRNNTGKSSLIDLLEFVRSGDTNTELGFRGAKPSAVVTARLEGLWSSNLQQKVAGSGNGNIYHQSFGNRAITWTIYDLNNYEVDKVFSMANPVVASMAKSVAHQVFTTYRSLKFARLAADRDLKLEEEEDLTAAISDARLEPDGSGATRILQRMLNQDNIQLQRFIEKDMIDDLNEIYGGDDKFVSIRASLRPSIKKFELYLDTRSGSRIPLTKMGSGVRTIILTLMMLKIYPRLGKPSFSPLETDDWKQYIFCFEELENNLHPAIQKRLFRFLRQFGERNGCTFVITTHSHIVIDLFSKDPDAQILHVFQGADAVKVETIQTHVHHNRVFSDLDVRASDLLQSNCVIWIEGPSDRTYMNRWINLVDPALQEHVDYEFAFTGGSVLHHIGFHTDNPDARIDALKLNRHAIILVDRDKAEGSDLKPWVERIKTEFTTNGGLFWITLGKEIENYIPIEALRVLLSQSELDTLPLDTDVLKFIKEKGGRNWENAKTELAEKVSKLLTLEMLQEHDVHDRTIEVCKLIRSWNDGA